MRNRTPCPYTLSILRGKVCPRCKEWQELLTGYKPRLNNPDGLSTFCNKCHREQCRLSTEFSREQQRIEEAEVQLIRMKMGLERVHPIKQKQPRHSKEIANKRTERIKANGGKFTAKQFKDLCEQYNWQCLRCKGHTTKLHADHVIPVMLGGSSDISNIQPLCRDCNFWKSTKHIDFR